MLPDSGARPSAEAAARPWWHRHLPALAPAWLACLAVERHALRTFFTADDLVALARAAGLEPTPWGFRPLSAALAARLEYAAFGLAPAGYHAVDMGLHLLATAGVYALALRLARGRATAAAAAVLFACSGIAFTPLHAASGIGDLLACVLLLAASLVHLAGIRRDRASWLWAAALLASAAALAKESAAAWPPVALALALHEAPAGRRWRAALPSLATGAVTAAWLALPRHGPGAGLAGPYALDFSPGHLALNLATYARWSVAVGTPMRDVVASADPGSVWPGLATGCAAVALVWRERHGGGRPIALGSAWWLAFLLPALPLAHHTYLYYLYVPWAGGAIAAAGAGAWIVGALRGEGPASAARGAAPPVRGPRAPLAASAGIALLALYVVAEARGVTARERATFDALPADRTLREASLLEHALAGLRAAALPPGTAVGFVNPVPRAGFRLPAPEAQPGPAERAAYVPLEAALRGGDALRLFVPGLADSGFAATIPSGWPRVQCFLYEQRGWLRPWGRGQEALMRQAELQAAMGRWAGAESSFARARAPEDTLPAALAGEAAALRRLGRADEAAALADTFARRWPGDVRGGLLRAMAGAGTPDPRLVRPFDPGLPRDARR